MDKYQPLRDAGTNGANYDLDTDAIITRLRKWDESYGITISDVKHDALTVAFDAVPEDVSTLAADVYAFCPDTVDQHFGCVAEMMEMAEETGQEVPPEIEQLVDGVDLDDDDYGVTLLERSIQKNKQVGLWWD